MFRKVSLLLLIVAAMFVVCASAETIGLYEPGDIFDVEFAVTANPNNAVFVEVELNYNENALKYLEGDFNQKGVATMLNINGIRVGQSLTARFQILPDSEAGLQNISLTVNEAYDYVDRKENPVTGLVFSESTVNISIKTTQNKCGDNLTWSLTENTLTILGTGDMENYEHTPPWYEYRDKIAYVQIGKGVTSIGRHAFLYCDAIVNVSIPDSVKKIETGCFSACTALKSVDLPNSLTTIVDRAFDGCTFTEITIPSNVAIITGNPFTYCKGLTTINLQSNAYFMIMDNALYTADGKKLISYMISSRVCSH